MSGTAEQFFTVGLSLPCTTAEALQNIHEIPECFEKLELSGELIHDAANLRWENPLWSEFEEINFHNILPENLTAQLTQSDGMIVNEYKKHARQEKWLELKERVKDETNTKLVKSIANENAKHMLKINKVADKLLDKIEITLDSLDVVDSQSIKHFTSALKDIKDIKGIKSEADLAEQEARINKLRKDCEDEQKDTSVEVVMGEEADDYAN